MTKIVEIWSCSCNIPKFSRKWLQVACNRKWTGYILVDFYWCILHTPQVTKAISLPEAKPKQFVYIGCDQLTTSMAIILFDHALHLLEYYSFLISNLMNVLNIHQNDE